MIENEELKRIRNVYSLSGNIEEAGLPWAFLVTSDEDIEIAVGKVLCVLEIISCWANSTWPNDEEVKEELPDWIFNRIEVRTSEQAIQLLRETTPSQWENLPWGFTSWVEAVKSRGWEWWSFVKENKNKARIVVDIVDMPERIDCFRELLRASGMKIIEQDYRLF